MMDRAVPTNIPDPSKARRRDLLSDNLNAIGTMPDMKLPMSIDMDRNHSR